MVTLQKKKARSGLLFKALKRQKLFNLPGAGIGTVVDILFVSNPKFAVRIAENRFLQQ